ncbi:diguanylate cyclase domain-containing protein [Fundidesulfovibrio terrae]|uniref:diguanylate cyclase domain-containing protein n=1 Tax=Fundidesulfovibrio terrae TaxID=2922866 RepID=UPI001FAF3773|nr:diguanylate cyclase [Fundidesulfovibrio terrae]
MKTIRLHRYTKALLTAYGVFSLGLLGTCILVLVQTREVGESAEKLYAHPFAVSNAALEAQRVLTSVRERVLYAALARDQARAQAAIEDIAQLDESFFKNLATVSDFYLGDKSEAEQAVALFNKWRSVRDGILETARQGEFDAAQGLILTLGTPAYEEISAKLDGIVAYSRDTAALFIGEAQRQTGRAQWTVYLIIALGFASSFACGLFIVRNVQRAICDNEAVLHHKAHHDQLTGLPNRTLFLDRLTEALDRAGRHGTSVGVLFIDLDDFKAVNDTLGHDAGDELLVLTAKRLTLALRGDDTIARLGGDEFVVVIPGVNSGRAAARVSEKVARALNAPARVKGAAIEVRASLGLAVSPQDGSDPYSLMAYADAAMYLAKSQTREARSLGKVIQA